MRQYPGLNNITIVHIIHNHRIQYHSYTVTAKDETQSMIKYKINKGISYKLMSSFKHNA